MFPFSQDYITPMFRGMILNHLCQPTQGLLRLYSLKANMCRVLRSHKNTHQLSGVLSRFGPSFPTHVIFFLSLPELQGRVFLCRRVLKSIDFKSRRWTQRELLSHRCSSFLCREHGWIPAVVQTNHLGGCKTVVVEGEASLPAVIRGTTSCRWMCD